MRQYVTTLKQWVKKVQLTELKVTEISRIESHRNGSNKYADAQTHVALKPIVKVRIGLS